MIYKLGFLLFIFSTAALAQTALDHAVLETKIIQTEEKLKNLTGNSLKDIAQRSNLENDLMTFKQEKGRRILSMAIEGTNTTSMDLTTPEFLHRYQRRTSDFGPNLNQIMDSTIEKSNPAIAGKKEISGRPLVLYRDVDPEDVFMAKDPVKGEIVVYKSKDLRGRPVYKDLNGNVTAAIIQRKVFPKEDVIIMNENGSLLKGTPKAIYADGTLEVRDQYGFTTKRQNGAYMLSDQIKSIENGQPIMYSGNKPEALSDKEKKALEALKKAMCGL